MASVARSQVKTLVKCGRVDAVLRHTARRCPFIKNNQTLIAAQDGELVAAVSNDVLGKLASRCPVVSPVVLAPARKLLGGSNSVCDAVYDVASSEIMDESNATPKLYKTKEGSCPTLAAPPRCPVTNVFQRPDAGQCPFASHPIPKASQSGGESQEVAGAASEPPAVDDSVIAAAMQGCPHSKGQIAAAAALGPDGTFDYDNKFQSLLDRKRADASYRIFNSMKRDVQTHPEATFFPKASPDIFDSDTAIDEKDLSAACKIGSHLGKPVDMWCSNDYLGMSRHPLIIKTVTETMMLEGVGSGGTRNISGNTVRHEKLEKELAALHQKESALLFGSCYTANDATLSTIGRLLPGCIFYSDSSNHASMIQGIVNSRCPKRVFRHNDFQHLEELMRNDDPNVPKIVAFESVYSMCGTIAPIKEICEVTKKYNGLTFLDEVHAVGLYGETGAGIAERDGLLDEIDIITGTLAKAYGTIGGYVASNKRFIDTVRSYASGFVFTSSLPPGLVAGASASVQFLKEASHLREEHQMKAREMINRLDEAGIARLPTDSHIVPILVGDAAICKQISDELLSDYGIYAQSINFPTVPRGTERLRVTPGPMHTPEMTDHFIDALTTVWNKYKLAAPFQRHY